MSLEKSEIYKEVLNKISVSERWPMIVIDGVVGVGKSTLMNILAEKGFTPFEEPVVDNLILEKFYYDRARYSFPLQVFFLNKRFKYIKEASKIEKCVLDRSIYGDIIFAKMLYQKGEMSEEEFGLYEDLLENILEHVNPPKLMIYLESSVDGAIKKINKRGRDYEQVVEKEYWQVLNKEYEEYFGAYKISPILRINVDGLDFENNLDDREYILKLIETKLEEITKSEFKF